MNDIEHLLKEDERSKRQNGKAIYHRAQRGGSKSCRFPHEYLSKKELKELNGKVESINLRKILSWKEFKKLNENLQREYINDKIENYGARYQDIAKAMGTNLNTMSQYVNRNIKGVKKTKPSKYMDKRWEDFIRLNKPAEEEKEECKEPEVKAPVNPVEAIREEAEALGIEMPERVKPTKIRGKISCEGNPALIFNRFGSLINSKKTYRMTIAFEEL